MPAALKKTSPRAAAARPKLKNPVKTTATRVSRGTKGMTITTREGGTESKRRTPYTKQNDPMVAFRAGERASAAKSPQARKAGPATPSKSLRTGPGKAPGLALKAKRGATVGDGLNAIGKFVGEVGANVSKSIPSRGASGIVPDTMKKLPKGGVMGKIKGN